jgi:hypothetical protein
MSENMLSEEVQPYDPSDNSEESVGGKKPRKMSSKKRVRKVHHKKSMKKRNTKKHGHKKPMKKRSTKKHGHKKGPSKWIMHVKAFCKKTGKTFPEALKDPMCKKSFKN